MRKNVMNESKYKYTGKTSSEVLNLEKEELSKLRAKCIKDLTYDEMVRYRHLLFRRNSGLESLKDHVNVLFNSTTLPTNLLLSLNPIFLR